MSEHNHTNSSSYNSSEVEESKKLAVSLKRRINELREVAKRMRADAPTTATTLQDKLNQLSESK